MTLFSGGYANETYLQSLNASSEDARRQVQNAIDEINRQRTVATTAAQQAGQTGVNTFLGARQVTAGDYKALRLNQDPALMRAFSEGATAYAQAGGHLIKGFHEQATQRGAQANNIFQSVIGDLRAKGMDYVGRRQAEDRERNFRIEEANRQRALQNELMNRQNAMQMQMLAAQAAEANKQRQWQEAMSLAALMQPAAPAPGYGGYTGSTGGSRAPGGAVLNPTAAHYTRPTKGLM